MTKKKIIDAEKVLERAGIGISNSFVIIDSSNPFVGSDSNFVYAIETLTEDGSFNVLEEAGHTVEAIKLNAGGATYPNRTVLPGKFTKIEPASGTVVLGWSVDLR